MPFSLLCLGCSCHLVTSEPSICMALEISTSLYAVQPSLLLWQPFSMPLPRYAPSCRDKHSSRIMTLVPYFPEQICSKFSLGKKKGLFIEVLILSMSSTPSFIDHVRQTVLVLRARINSVYKGNARKRLGFVISQIQ